MFINLDPLYWVLILPALILSIIATIMTKVRFAKYSRRAAASGFTGVEAAQRLLDTQGIRDVEVEEVRGFLSDHYDPRSRKLRLSPEVYESQSLAAIGVACHEAGHAIQHATKYAPLGLRTALVPAAMIGSYAPYILFPLGVILSAPGLIKLGCLVFALAVLFSVVALPVEWNASNRSKELMVSAGIVSPGERGDAAKVLNAAFLTYVAAAVMALLTLLYYLLRSGLLGGRRD